MRKIYTLIFVCVLLLIMPDQNAWAQTPCTGSPAANTVVVTPSVPVCPGTATLTLANGYTVTGITYQWFSSTVATGPFNAINGATFPSYTTPSLTTPMYYQVAITCTNGNLTFTTGVATVSILPAVTTSFVPAYEGFQLIQQNNQLPNCSWAISNALTCQTYTQAGGYGTFFYTPVGPNYFYTNGIQLLAGVVYSAAVFYKTNPLGQTNWSDLSILMSASQTPVGQTTIASTNGPALGVNYTPLSNTLTVPLSGIYYFAIRGTSAGAGANNLFWDDFSITVPCTPAYNTPTVNILASSNTVCAGPLGVQGGLTLTAQGANTYTWGNGQQGSVITPTGSVGSISVAGTNSASGCSSTASVVITINPYPNVIAYSSVPYVCSGTPVNLTAIGATSYIWSSGGLSSVVSVTPNVNTTYTVTGINNFGCSATSTVMISVLPIPVITAVSSRTSICAGEKVTLTATGANTYQWNSVYITLVGGSVTTTPSTTIVFSLTATDTSGCSAKTNLQISVSPCSGVTGNGTQNIFRIFPNPGKGIFVVEGLSEDKALINVMDLEGRVLFEKELQANQRSIDISEYPSGVYFIKIRGGTNIETLRLLKE
jgi:hypothetical protein